MILCHEYRFIFIKTFKTAGTSMEIALSKYCGPRDIITRIKPDDEQIRRDLGYRGPQNVLVPISRYTAADWLRLFRLRRRAAFVNHMFAPDVRSRVAAPIWDSYTKFAIERNPWDAAISRYYWETRDVAERPPLSDFLEAASREGTLSNFPIYTIDGVVAVDHVIRYEDLDAGLEWLQSALKLPDRPALPRAKSAFRADRRHYSQVIGPQDRDFIAQACSREIELFGYTFETPAG